MSLVFIILPVVGQKFLETKYGTREKTVTSVCFIFAALFVAHSYYTCGISHLSLD